MKLARPLHKFFLFTFFYHPPSSSYMHRSLCATLVFFKIWHTWLPCWLWSLDLSIKGPFTHLPGEVTEMSVFCLCGVRARQAGKIAWGAISGEWEMTEPVIRYFPLWDFGLVFVFGHPRRMWHESNFSIIGHGDKTIDVATHLFAHPFGHLDPGL